MCSCMCLHSSHSSANRPDCEKCLLTILKRRLIRGTIFHRLLLALILARSLAPAVNTAVGFGNETSGDFTHTSPAVIAHAGETEREMFSQGANVVDPVCVIRPEIVGMK